MMIRKFSALLGLAILSVMIAFPIGVAGSSSFEVGVKVPLSGFASVSVSEQMRLEVSAVIPGFSAPLVDLEGMVAVKLYPGSVELGDFAFQPFVGGGALFLEAVGEMIPGLVVLAGVEHTALELPLTIFGEGSGALLMSGSAPMLVFQLSLGARYAFEF